jgi:hypothetical protein
VGYTDGSKRRDYETRIWLAQGKQALRLTPYPHTWSAYTLTLRAFAALMAGQGRIANIEGGYSKFDALFAPVLTGLVALGAIGVSLFALGNSPWWARLIVPAVPLAVFGMLLYVGMARSWPRPLTDLAELEGQLPPVASEPATLQDRLWVLIGGRRRK